MHSKLLQKRTIQKTAETTDALIGNKTASRITKFSKTLQRNNSETVTNEHDNGIPKKKIYMVKRKTEKNQWSKINMIIE